MCLNNSGLVEELQLTFDLRYRMQSTWSYIWSKHNQTFQFKP